jgi:hypothetical protein
MEEIVMHPFRRIRVMSRLCDEYDMPAIRKSFYRLNSTPCQDSSLF